MATYINLENLSRYDMKVKARSKDAYADASAACWQKTEKAGAVTCVPSPETPLEPVVEFKFKETPPASGDKSTNNPSVITGVSSVKVTRCGKNLIKLPFFTSRASVEINGITFALDQTSGTITANGTATADARLYFVGASSEIKLIPGKTYYASGCPSGGSVSTYYIGASRYTLNNEYLASLTSDIGSGTQWTTDSTCYFVASTMVKSGTTVSNLVFKPRLEEGPVATDFEPYAGTDFTVNLNDTYYGGTLDVASGKLTVTHRKLVLDGIEAWSSPNSMGTYNRFTYLTNVFPDNADSVDNACTHIPFDSSYSGDFLHYYVSTGNSRVYLFTTHADTDSLKAWLASEYTAGHPVTLVYKLAEPYTIQLDPVMINALPALDKTSPRINTIYTDAENVQVGYAEHPAYTEQQINNAILALGGDI